MPCRSVKQNDQSRLIGLEHSVIPALDPRSGPDKGGIVHEDSLETMSTGASPQLHVGGDEGGTDVFRHREVDGIVDRMIELLSNFQSSSDIQRGWQDFEESW